MMRGFGAAVQNIRDPNPAQRDRTHAEGRNDDVSPIDNLQSEFGH